MADHVYRRFSGDDLLHTTVRAQPHFQFDSGTGGWTGSTGLGNALSLYGGVRQRSDVSSYQLAWNVWNDASASQYYGWYVLSSSQLQAWTAGSASAYQAWLTGYNAYNVSWTSSRDVAVSGYNASLSATDPALASGVLAYYTFPGTTPLNAVLPAVPSSSFPFSMYATGATGGVAIASGVLQSGVMITNPGAEFTSPLGIPAAYYTPFTNGSYTVSAWLYVDPSSSTNQNWFTLYSDGGYTHQFGVYLTASMYGVRLFGTNIPSTTSSVMFSASQWHHVVVSFSHSYNDVTMGTNVGDLYMYIDGQAAGAWLNTSGGYASHSVNYSWEIGGLSYASGSFIGRVDTLQIMNVTASLSQAQDWYAHVSMTIAGEQSVYPPYAPPTQTAYPAFIGPVQPQAPAPPAKWPLQVFPLDEVDSHSIDKVIGVPGAYPQTGSVNLVYCVNKEQPDANAITDTRWFDEHWSAINLLSDWHHKHTAYYYPALDQLPATMSLVHVPAMFYGRKIATGSVLIQNNAWQSASGSNVWADTGGGASIGLSGSQFYADDGHGRLLIYRNWADYAADMDDFKDGVASGTITDLRRGVGGLVTGTDHRPLVAGYVFYDEGLVVLTHPSGVWHQQFLSQSYALSASTAHIGVRFDGETVLQSFVFMCRMAPAEVNASNNPTYYSTDAASGKRWANGSGTENVTYVTAVGIYNEERQLVAVAKIAQPIRKRERDNVDIRLRLDI